MRETARRTGLGLLAALLCSGALANEAEVQQLRERVEELEQRLERYEPYFDRIEFFADVDAIAAQTAEMRGLPLKTTLIPHAMTRAELRGYLRRLVEEEADLSAEEAQGRLMQLLGIAPQDVDLTEVTIASYGDNLGGFYNDTSETLFVITDDMKLGPGDRITLAHEICHALQDQHYNLGKMSDRHENGDQAIAARAVIEGDAVMLMREWGEIYNVDVEESPPVWAGVLEERDMSQLQDAPQMPAMEFESAFPYIAGLAFIETLRVQGAPQWRSLPFFALPESTEQILHTDRYYPRSDPPRRVELPDWKDRGLDLEPVAADVMGEWRTRLVLTRPDEFPPNPGLMLYDWEPTAYEGARGWGGDEVVLLEDEEALRWAMAWRTLWDAPVEAEEFADAYARRARSYLPFKGLDDLAAPAPGDGDTVTWDGAEGIRLRMNKSGDRVDLVLASDAEVLDAVWGWLGTEK